MLVDDFSQLYIIYDLQVASLHSMIPQRERTAALTEFRSNKTRILVCTDVAARGLDIPHVSFCFSLFFAMISYMRCILFVLFFKMFTLYSFFM